MMSKLFNASINKTKELDIVKPTNNETHTLPNVDPSNAIYATVDIEKKRNSKKEKHPGAHLAETENTTTTI